jgi:hypothetical protein
MESYAVCREVGVTVRNGMIYRVFIVHVHVGVVRTKMFRLLVSFDTDFPEFVQTLCAQHSIEHVFVQEMMIEVDFVGGLTNAHVLDGSKYTAW